MQMQSGSGEAVLSLKKLLPHMAKQWPDLLEVVQGDTSTMKYSLIKICDFRFARQAFGMSSSHEILDY